MARNRQSTSGRIRGSKRPSQKLVTKNMFVNMLNSRRELKYIEVSSESNMPIDGGIVPITQAIIQGDTNGTHDGESINVTELRVRLELALNASALLDFCRLIIFSDNQANGVYPTVSGPTNGILTATDPNASYDFPVAIRHRFKILLDQDFAMSINGNSRVIQFDKKIKLHNHKVNYSGTTNAEASNSKGAIYALLISDTGTNFTAYNLVVAVKFFDS